MRRDAYRDVGGRPRLERAVEGRRPVAARRKPESRRGMPRWRGDGGFCGMAWGGGSLWWSCPLCGQGWSKPLDSGFRRNDGGGFRLSPGGTGVPGRSCQTWLCHPNSAGAPINDDITPRHSSAGWNPGGRRRGGPGMAGFAGCPLPCRFSYPFLSFQASPYSGRSGCGVLFQYSRPTWMRPSARM